MRALFCAAALAASAAVAAAQYPKVGTITELLPEASDAAAAGITPVDGKSGDTDFPFGNFKPIWTIGEVYDGADGEPKAMVGVPDGQGAYLVDDNTVRLVSQSESYGPLRYESWGQPVNDGATTFGGSHAQYVDVDRTKLAGFMAGNYPASEMIKAGGELIETVYNLKGELVGPRNPDGPSAKPHYSDTDVNGNWVVSAVPTLSDWFFQSFCSSNLAPAGQWGSNFGFVDDVYLTVEEWTNYNKAGFIGIPNWAVDIATKTAYPISSIGMGGFEKISEMSCGVEGFVCIAVSGYNGNFGASSELKAETIAARVAAGKTRKDGKDWFWPQDVVPARIYVGRKGYDKDGKPANDFMSRNGLAYGKVYGFATEKSVAEAGRDKWHKSADRTKGEKVQGVFYPTSYMWDGVVKPFELDESCWGWQDAPVGAPDNHMFWNGNGTDGKGAKWEHISPDPRGGQRFLQGSTAGYFGIYDAQGLVEALKASTGTDFPASFGGEYTMLQAESDITAQIELGGKGQTSNPNVDQTVMCDKGGDRENCKVTFEDIDGIEWIAGKDCNDYIIIQEDGGNDYGERQLITGPVTYDSTPLTYYFTAQAGGDANTRVVAKATIPAGTWSRNTASEFSGVTDLSQFLVKDGSGKFLMSDHVAHRYMHRAAAAMVDINDKTIMIGLQQHSQAGGIIAELKADRGGQVLAYQPNGIPANAPSTCASIPETKLMKVGEITELLPEASDAAAAGITPVDGKSGDTDFPFGNFKPIWTIGEVYDGADGEPKAMVGVPDGQGAYLVDDNTVRLVSQSESYGPLRYESWGQPVNDGATTFGGSHAQYVDVDRTKLAGFMAGNYPASEMIKAGGELIETVYNLKGELVGPRNPNGPSAKPHYSDTDVNGNWVVSAVPTLSDWFFQSFCSSNLAPAGQWGSNFGFVDDVYLTVEEWTNYNKAGFIGIPNWAVDIATKTAYPISSIGMGGFEKISEMSCGVEGFVCIAVSGYNGAFGASSELKAETIAARVAAGKTRKDGKDWAWPQNIVPARIYVGRKGYDKDGKPANDFMSRNGLAYGKVYGFATEKSAPNRDTWHKSADRTKGEKVQGVFYPTSYMWDGVVKPFELDESCWGWQDAPVGAPDNHMFWTGLGPDAKGAKWEHCSPDPRGGQRFLQGSTDGYFGIYDAQGLVEALKASTGTDFPASFGGEYTMLQAESDITAQIELGGKGQTSNPNVDQTVMCDKGGERENCKVTFEDIDGIEWIAGKDCNDYIIIQEDGGNDYGERQLITSPVTFDSTPLTYYFTAQAGGNANTRVVAKATIPAGTWSNNAASEFSGVTDLSQFLVKDGSGKFLMSSASADNYMHRAAAAMVDINDKTIMIGLQQHSQAGGIIAALHADRGGQVLAYQPNGIPANAPSTCASIPKTKAPEYPKVGTITELLPEASDAAAAGITPVDGKSGDTDFPFGNFKPIWTIGEVYDGADGEPKAMVGVPDGQGAYLVDDNTVRLVSQSESYGPLRYESWGQPVNDGATTFGGSHAQYVDVDRTKLAGFMAGNYPASEMIKAGGELIETVYNLKGELVGPRNPNGPSAKPHYSDTDVNGNWVVSAVPTLSDWFFQSFCSSNLAPAGQWGSNFGFVDDVYLTVEEWTNYNKAGFIGIPNWAVDIATKTAYPISSIGMGGFEKISEMSCGVEGFVCIAVSGYNGNFGVSKELKAETIAARVAAGKTRKDGKDWFWPQDVVPARIYVGRKGYDKDGKPANDFMSRNGLAYGKVYGFATEKSVAEAGRDKWHKSADRTKGEKVQGVFYPTSYMWDGVVKPFEHDESCWGWQDAPVGAPDNHMFWNGNGTNGKGAKWEHCSPDPRGGQRFLQGSTAGYFGIYDAQGLVEALKASTGTDFPASFGGEYTMLQAESDITAQIELGGKGQTSNPNVDQTVMCDKGGERENCKVTFEDIDGIEWIAGKDCNDYIIIQEDGGNDYGERQLITSPVTFDSTPLTYYFTAQAGGDANTRVNAKATIPAGTWSRNTASEFSGVTDLSQFLVKDGSGKFLMSDHVAHRYMHRAAAAMVDINDKTIMIGLQQHSQAGGIIAELKADRGGQVLAYQPNGIPANAPSTCASIPETKLMKVGEITELLPEASDAAAAGITPVDGKSGDTDFPFGNFKPIWTIGEVYDGADGEPKAMVGVPDGQGAYLVDDNTVRLVSQSESYGPLRYESWAQPVNGGATTFGGSHAQYVDVDRTKLAGFMAGNYPASEMIKAGGELIETVYNLKGELVGPRNPNGPSAKPHYSDTDVNGNWVVSKVPTLSDWFFQSFCSSNLAPAGQWGSNFGFVDDVYLTVEEWTDYNKAGFIGIPSWAVDIATKTAYPISSIGMGGFEKISEMSCGVEGFVCIAVSGYNGAFGAPFELQAEAIAARVAAGKTRKDGKDWSWPQNIVPARIYVGRKGYDKDGKPANDFMSRNGLAYGKVYGFATEKSAPNRDTWHKSADRTKGEKVQGVFYPTSYMWDGVVKPFEHDESCWGWQDAPVGAPDNHKFWTGSKKWEHCSPDPRGGQRFLQGSTEGYFGIYDAQGLVEALKASTGTDFPASFGGEYTMLQAESDITAQIELGGKGQTSNPNVDQTVMCDKGGERENCKVTFEDIDGIEWIAGKDCNDYIIIQEDGGNDYGERQLITGPVTFDSTPLTYYFTAQAGGNANTRVVAKATIPAGTWSGNAASEFSGITDLSQFLVKDSSGKFLMSSASADNYMHRAAAAMVDINDKTIMIGLQQHSQAGGIIAALHADRGGQVLAYQPNGIPANAPSTCASIPKSGTSPAPAPGTPAPAPGTPSTPGKGVTAMTTVSGAMARGVFTVFAVVVGVLMVAL